MAENKNNALKLTGIALVAFLFISHKSGAKVRTEHGALNNPGNIRTEPKVYPGEIISPNADFLSFTSMAYGYAAMIIKLRSYFASGYVTLWQIINHWAPAEDGNDPGAYVAYILDHMGPEILVDPDAPFPVYDNNTVSATISLMSDVEQGAGFGSDYWSDVIKAFELV